MQYYPPICSTPAAHVVYVMDFFCNFSAVSNAPCHWLHAPRMACMHHTHEQCSSWCCDYTSNIIVALPDLHMQKAVILDAA